MFGYIKLDTDAPKKCKDYFTRHYCFLCRSLSKHFGLLARLVVSFDVTFFQILFSESMYLSDVGRVRCWTLNPKQKERLNDDFAKKTAALNLILAAGNLDDKVNDGDHWYARLLRAFFGPVFKKAQRTYPEMWQTVKKGHALMSSLEKENAPIEAIECCFADFIESIARENFGIDDEARLSYLRYVAKMLYYMDALDDLDRDIRQKSYHGLSDYQSKEKYILQSYTAFGEHVRALRNELMYVKPTDLNTLTVDRLIYVSIPERLSEIAQKGIRL